MLVSQFSILSTLVFALESFKTIINLMKKSFSIFLAVISPLFVILPTVPGAIAQSSSYRLKTQFTGDNKCLDIINDGENNKPIMADCGNYSGQLWQVERTKQSGYYRLKTQFTGKAKCLDIINDGENNKPTMADCGNYSGQFWKIERTKQSGYSRFKTQFTGENKCLDIINDGKNNKPTMADCGNYSGQFWKTPKGI